MWSKVAASISRRSFADRWWQTLSRICHCSPFEGKEPSSLGVIAMIIEKVPASYLPATLVVACYLQSC